jgi:enamine deaminase RidA (YjgF/YER057c/UK114 family)
MSIELSNPPGIPTPEHYRQMAVATGSRTVYLAGQVARTADGEPVGAGDLAAQVEQAYLNVATALESVGGTFADVAKITLYVVGWSPEKLADLGAGVGRAAERLGLDLTRPVTLLPVPALAEPDLLVEVDAVAVLP